MSKDFSETFIMDFSHCQTCMENLEKLMKYSKQGKKVYVSILVHDGFGQLVEVDPI